ncbi:MAG: ribonuclease III [Treponema sp.]|jgi:ribonuclease-3|nr:ribonuclease III [Treponema sp.]
MRSPFCRDNNLSIERKKELEAFCRPLKLKFHNFELLELAFHHRSYSNENTQNHYCNNERLEFLGDSVLGMATAAFLYQDMRENPEGDLAKIKAVVVSENTLAPIGRRIGIDTMLVLGRGEEMSGGRKKKAILADCMEAVIGAYYLDSGYKAAESYVLSFIIPEIRKVQQNKGEKDYKTMLQEFYQKKYKKCPVYELIRKTGPDHDRTFHVVVHLGDSFFGPAEGKSKKAAEQNAAEIAWTEIRKNHS